MGWGLLAVYVHPPRYEFVTKFSFQRDCGESIGLKAGSEKRLIVVFSQVSPSHSITLRHYRFIDPPFLVSG